MKKLVYILIISVFAVILVAASYLFISEKEAKKDLLVLSSGSKGSPYFENADYIKKLLEDSLKIEVKNWASEGSYENFTRLQNKTTDLIIAQRDVIIKKYYSDENLFKNFKILLPLFREALQILVKDSTNRIISFKEFKARIDSGIIKSIGIGEKESATNKTFHSLQGLLELDVPSKSINENSLSESVKDFENGSLDALVYFAAPPIKKFNPDKTFAIVSFDQDEINLALKCIKDLDSTSFNAKLYFKGTKEKIYTAGTWAFLISNSEFKNSSDQEVIDKIPGIIINDVFSKKPKNQIQHSFQCELFSFKRNDDSTCAVRPNGTDINKLFMDIPLSKGVSTLFGVFRFKEEVIIGLILILLISVLVVVFRNNRNIYIIKWREKYGHNLYVIVFTIAILMGLCYIVRKSELLNFYEHGINSPILNLGFKDTLEWLSIFVFTHHDSHIFPLSITGAIAASSAFVLASGALLSSVVIQIIQNDKIKKRAMGKLEIKWTDHIVICGWNNKTADLAVNLIDASEKYTHNKCNVALLNDKIEDFESNVKHDVLHSFYHRGFVQHYSGDATDIEALKKVNIQNARTVIIISEGKSKQDDEKVLLTAYTVSNYCKEEKHTSEDSMYIVAEITDPVYISRLEKADVSVIISTGELVNNLIVQDSICRGIYNPIRSLIAYSDKDNDFYSIQIKHYHKLRNKTFDQLQDLLRKERLQLIGFKKIFMHDDTPVIDKNIIEKEVKKKGLNSEYIINPQNDEENEERTEINDEIILLGISMTDVDKKLKVFE